MTPLVLASAAVRSLRFFARALVIALIGVLLTGAGAIAQTPSPAASVAPSVKPGPPAPYYAAWGLMVLAALTVIATLAAYLYHAPGFRQRTGRGAAS
jgi:hypothetical protein